MSFSAFGEKFTRHSGIARLMEDMDEGLRTPGAVMLGGGNPAQIPEMNDYFQQLLQQMHEQGKLTEALCNYDGPRGKSALLDSLSGLLREQFGWQITPQNIALTNGSQSAFFYLFNLYAGRRNDGSKKRVLFPLAPEYLGYADAGWTRTCSSQRAPISKCCRKDSLNITSILSICTLVKIPV